ncbi:MAG: class I SAM-dependent methyltransferase [Myxococcales bacterium]|nr:class I SAM-dependent methyltransferase [Myxococcales bacterium]
MINDWWNEAIAAAEMGRIGDNVIRAAIKTICLKRSVEIFRLSANKRREELERFTAILDQSEIVIAPEIANAQHYEVPAEWFQHMLGPRMKYSCCAFSPGVTDLAVAEDVALAETCRRAELKDGHRIVELGCGWGSLTIWMAERFPASSIVAVSNSASQKRFIEDQLTKRGLTNVRVITANVAHWEPDTAVDRVVSVEMFEHLRNWRRMFQKIASWLTPDGRFFMHIFCHRFAAYLYETTGADDWMGRNFFSDGMMPSRDLPAQFQDDLRLVRTWTWDGRQYQKTAAAWLSRFDNQKSQLTGRFDPKEIQRWRIFLMAVEEMFGWRQGKDWGVGHYLFERKG